MLSLITRTYQPTTRQHIFGHNAQRTHTHTPNRTHSNPCLCTFYRKYITIYVLICVCACTELADPSSHSLNTILLQYNTVKWSGTRGTNARCAPTIAPSPLSHCTGGSCELTHAITMDCKVIVELERPGTGVMKRKN